MEPNETNFIDPRYARQVRFAGIGEEGQLKLSQARVAIVGLGALGTMLADQIVRAGAGYVRIIDRDYVDESNLQRQSLYNEHDAHAAAPKAIAAANKLAAANSHVQIDAHIADLNALNAEQLLSDVHLILDGSDNFAVRYLINDVSLKKGIPWIYGAAVASRGVSFTIIPHETPCLRCLFPQPPAAGIAETCDTAGIIAPAAHIVASHQIAEALKLLIGKQELLNRKMYHFDLWLNQNYAIDVSNAHQSNCPACGQNQYEYLEAIAQDDMIISLCGRSSIQINPINKAVLSLEDWEAKLNPLGAVTRNAFLLKFNPSPEIQITLFPDGRAIIQGITDHNIAKSFYAKYLGM
jgi:molybdopterin-synthase adenylyltransferase